MIEAWKYSVMFENRSGSLVYRQQQYYSQFRRRFRNGSGFTGRLTLNNVVNLGVL